LDELHGVLVSWEDDTRERRAFKPRTQLRQGVQIESSTRFLLGQLEWIMGRHPYAEATRAFGWEVTSVHAKVQKATQQTDVTPERCVGVRCPRCNWKALIREVIDHRATGYVACQNCGRLLGEAEYHTAVHASLLRERQ
jgi:ribosomal protein S27E